MVWVHIIMGGNCSRFLCRVFNYTEIWAKTFIAFFDKACSRAAIDPLGGKERFWTAVHIDLFSIYTVSVSELSSGLIEYEEEKLLNDSYGRKVCYDFYH